MVKSHRAVAPVPAAPGALPPPLRLLCAVALLSAAVLGVEIALTRVFAVLLRYHFAFLVISIALCGLGVGGFLAHWARRRRPLVLSHLALAFGGGVVLALALTLRVVFPLLPEAYWLTAVLILLPFTAAGAFLAELFAGHAAWSGRLYAWDLAGAAIAAVAVIALLQVVSAIDACLLLGGLGALAGALATVARREQLLAGGLACLCAVGVVANRRGALLDIPPIPPPTTATQASLADRGVTQPLFTELGDPGHSSRILTTRWNAFARTDVVREDAQTYLIYTNGNVPTNMMAWDGRVESLGPIAASYPLVNWAFANAPLGERAAPRGRVLSIGPGGGLDCLLGLWHGAAQVDGAELNPSIVGLMQDYRAFNGRVYEHPRVRVVTAEGRAFVREQAARGQRYALIFSALTKTATAGQGMALLESFIHTQEAVEDYLAALEPNGQLIWLVDNENLLLRFFTTAVAALETQGIDAPTACRHIALVADPRPIPYRFALVLQRSPITPAQAEAMMSPLPAATPLTPIWVPGRATAAPAVEAVATGKLSLAGLIAAYEKESTPPLDIAPCPDDRPFVLDLSPGILPVFTQLAAVALFVALGLALLGWRSIGRLTASDVRYLLYFLALGVGFMLVEVPLISKLILPLGYPTLALAVILCAVLLGGGLGSAWSQRVDGEAARRRGAGAAGAVALGTLGLLLILPALQTALVGVALPVRCLLVGGLLLPLGFALGIPFPTGLRLFAQTRPSLVPLVWGINGVAAVVGSLLAAMGGKVLGFSAVLACGAMAYLLALLLLRQRG
jgi:hypothetical protein